MARGNVLDVLRPSTTNDGILETVVSKQVYGSIRGLSTLRLWGGEDIDHIVMTADSGAVTVLSLEGSTLTIVSQTFFGKTGCRRVVPGQMVACETSDNGGRVMMVAASEKQKLVFKVGRGEDNSFVTSSALSVNQGRTITFDSVATDVGTDHPEFACLEMNYGPIDDGEISDARTQAPKMLSYYKMDLTLNNVVLTSSTPTVRSANRLIPVPGGTSGPGGVLILAENCIVYQQQGGSGGSDLQVRIPSRSSSFGRGSSSPSSPPPPPRPTFIVAHAAIAQREQKVFFCLVQTEEGDLFRASLVTKEEGGDATEGTAEVTGGGKVIELKLTYFDTIPVCSSLCISRNGLLFAASEYGDHTLYRIVGDGATTDVEGGTSSSSDSRGNAASNAKKAKTGNTGNAGYVPTTLHNLEAVETVDSTAAILDVHVEDLCSEGTPQMYALCGRGSRSSLRVLRYGLPVDDFTKGAALPGVPTRVWSIRKQIKDVHHSYIVVSFVDSTLVLSVGENVREVKDSGFEARRRTLHVVTLGDNAGHAQVHPEGILMVLPGKEKTEWKTPLGKQVVCADGNERQIVVGLEGGTIVYFEMGPNGQMLNSGTYEVGAEITCVDLGAVPAGRLQSQFLGTLKLFLNFFIQSSPFNRQTTVRSLETFRRSFSFLMYILFLFLISGWLHGSVRSFVVVGSRSIVGSTQHANCSLCPPFVVSS